MSFQSGALGDPDNLLPLDKIPTNEFIEKFLEDDSSESGKKDSTSTNMNKENKPKIKVDPLPDISDDDLETVLDIEGKTHSWDLGDLVPDIKKVRILLFSENTSIYGIVEVCAYRSMYSSTRIFSLHKSAKLSYLEFSSQKCQIMVGHVLHLR